MDDDFKLKSSVKIQKSLKSSIKIAPRIWVKFFECDSALVSNKSSVIAVLDADKVENLLVIPVESLDETGLRLNQIKRPGIGRYMNGGNLYESPNFLQPVVISAPPTWVRNNGRLELYERALVLDGAKRLEAALAFQTPKHIPALVIWGMSPSEELDLRKSGINANSIIEIKGGVEERFDTDTQQFSIKESWTELTILTEPFVVPGRYGYSPALLVRRSNSKQVEHIFVSAKSLATKLEDIRRQRGGLTGLVVKVKKMGEERTAPYEVEAVE